jgi:hypothetical protein
MSKEIDNFAASVAEGVTDESNKFGSLMITLMIVSIVVSILRLMQSCNLFGKTMEERIKNPGPVDRMLLKKAIRDNLTKDQLHLKGQIFEEVLKKTPQLSSAQIQKMVQEMKESK